MLTKSRKSLLLVMIVLSFAAVSSLAFGLTQIMNICRVKGQEENVLRGVGLVVGLNGTGESNDPTTMRAIQRAIQIMGDGQQGDLDELKKIKNVSLVMVSATV